MEDSSFNKNISVYIVSYPGTGSDWVVELVTLLFNNFNFENSTKPVEDRYQNTNIIKTEMTYDLLENTFKNGTQNKIIYVIRNPEKTCISLYYETNVMQNAHKLESFCNVFLNGQLSCGSYWEHVTSYWLNRHYPEILFIQFEHIQNRLPQVIKKVADFLAKPLTECEILSLVYHLCIPNLQRRPSLSSSMKMYDITLPSEISKRFTEQSEYYQKKIGLNLC